MNVCDDCVMRLFNTKKHNLQGIGNPYFSRCIVIPNVDYISYKNKSISFSEQVKIIEEILITSTGELDILNYLYIVPLIRCCDKLNCEITDDIYNKCITYFANDIRKYQFTDIMLLGTAGKRFLRCDIKDNTNILYISRNNRRYILNYSPLVKYTNEELYKEFKSNLIRWFNNVRSGYYNYPIQTIK